MALNLILVTVVFIIGYGWGVATAWAVYYRRVKMILDHCTKILNFCGNLLKSNEETRKQIGDYAELTHISFNAAFNQNEKIVQGLGKLVEAVREEVATDEKTGSFTEGSETDRDRGTKA